MTPEVDGDDEAGFDEVTSKLPKLQAFPHPLRRAMDRLKRALYSRTCVVKRSLEVFNGPGAVALHPGGTVKADF